MLQQLNASHAVRYVEWVDAGRMLLLFRCACLRIMQQSLPCTHASSKKLQKRTSTRLRCRQKSGQSLRCKQESHSIKRTAHHLPWFFFLLSTTILTTIHFTLCSSLLASRGCEHHIASRGCETESIHISCVCSVCDTHLACRTAAVQLTPGM